MEGVKYRSKTMAISFPWFFTKPAKSFFYTSPNVRGMSVMVCNKKKPSMITKFPYGQRNLASMKTFSWSFACKTLYQSQILIFRFVLLNFVTTTFLPWVGHLKPENNVFPYNNQFIWPIFYISLKKKKFRTNIDNFFNKLINLFIIFIIIVN